MLVVDVGTENRWSSRADSVTQVALHRKPNYSSHVGRPCGSVSDLVLNADLKSNCKKTSDFV